MYITYSNSNVINCLNCCLQAPNILLEQISVPRTHVVPAGRKI